MKKNKVLNVMMYMKKNVSKILVKMNKQLLKCFAPQISVEDHLCWQTLHRMKWVQTKTKKRNFNYFGLVQVRFKLK